MRRFLVMTAVELSVGPANAGPPARCAMLGQLARGTWREMIGPLARQETQGVDRATVRLDDLTGSYRNLGRDAAALGNALDCLLNRSGSAPPRDLARTCLGAAGLGAEP